MSVYAITEKQPGGDWVYSPQMCAYVRLVEGNWDDGEWQRMVEKEIERRGFIARQRGGFFTMPPLGDPPEYRF